MHHFPGPNVLNSVEEIPRGMKNVIYTGVDLQVIHFYLNSYKTPACKVICTEIVTQELLHRSSADFQVIKLYLNSCKIRLLQFFYFSLAAGTARRWLTKRYPLRHVGHPNLWRNAGLFVLGQPSAEIVRFERTSMWWNVNFFWARAALCRDRAGRTSKHAAKCKFGATRCSPFARNEGQPSKTGVKL